MVTVSNAKLARPKGEQLQKKKSQPKSVTRSGKQGDAILIKRTFDNSDFWVRTLDLSKRKRKPRRKKDVKSNHVSGIVTAAVKKHEPRMSPGGRDMVFTADDGSNSHTTSDGGGSKISNINVHLFLWGSAWLSPGNNPNASSVINAVDSILSGPYFNALNQYGVGSGLLADSWIITSPDPNNPFSDGDVKDMVWNLIDAGYFPEPDDAGGANEFFAFVMPPGVNTNQAGVNGEHMYAWDYDFPFDIDKAWCCWVMNDGTLDTVTTILSHELVEACTDPEGDGWQVDPRSGDSWNEIGDICQNSTGRVNGVMVQAYWSQRDNACIIPSPGNNTQPPEFRRRITINASFHTVDPGVFSDDVGDFSQTKSIVLDSNNTTGQVVFVSPVVGGESSANLIFSLTWNNDLSITVNYSSALFDDSDTDTSGAWNFNLGRDTWQSWWINHHSGDWIEADSCHIDFDIHNDQF